MRNHRWTSPIYPQKISFMFFLHLNFCCRIRLVACVLHHNTWPNRHEFPKMIINRENQYSIAKHNSAERLSLTLFWQWKRCEICAKNISSGNSRLHPFVFMQMPVQCWYSLSSLIFDEISRSRVLSVHKHTFFETTMHDIWKLACEVVAGVRLGSQHHI